jgi:hypothetical protein
MHSNTRRRVGEQPLLNKRGSRSRWVGLLTMMFWLTMFNGRFPAILDFPADRTLYFKLPIEGARFHWQFLEPNVFLSGELTLRIVNKERDDTLVVFRDGKISDGWQMIGSNTRDSAFYFGFSTGKHYRTALNDSLIITLRAPQDLRGRGPYKQGTLPAGTWQSTGTYSSVYGERWNPLDLLVRFGKPSIAFLECWDTVWPIQVTSTNGWRGIRPADEDNSGWFRDLMNRGVDGRLCTSSIQTD